MLVAGFYAAQRPGCPKILILSEDVPNILQDWGRPYGKVQNCNRSPLTIEDTHNSFRRPQMKYVIIIEMWVHQNSIRVFT